MHKRAALVGREERHIQHPAAESRGRVERRGHVDLLLGWTRSSSVTSDSAGVTQTATVPAIIVWKEIEGRDVLTAISISSELSLVWMAANPPNSPNFTAKREKKKKKEHKKQRY